MDLTNLSLLRNPRAAQRPTAGVVQLRREIEGADVLQLRDGSGSRLEALSPVVESPTTPGEALMVVLAELEKWLALRADRPPAQDFLDWRRTALRAHPTIDGNVFDAGRRLLGSDILSLPPASVSVRRLTRLVLLLELLDPDATTDAELASQGRDTELVFDLLRRRTPLLPQGIETPVPAPRVELVRGARVSDLFVVRSEWSCYLLGEIAAVTNVLPHEEFSKTTCLTEEQERTTTLETQRVESAEKSEEDRTQSELSREVNRSQELQVRAEASVNVSGKMGLMTLAASASGGVSASLSESSRQASRLSREVVSKAISKVESRVREERIQRTLTRSVDRTRHAINNATESPVRGVYRWIDRCDRYQVFRYPDRLQLEFEIPEPAEYLRYRLRRPQPPSPGGVEKPPALIASATQINAGNAATLALTYHASGLPPPPDEEISVSAAASLSAAGQEKEVDGKTEQWAAPELEKLIDVVIPKNYAARSVAFAATAMPKRAPWHVEWEPGQPLQGGFVIDGFHQITLTVVAGGDQCVHQKNGTKFDRFAVQMSPALGGGSDAGARPSTYFGDAYLSTPMPPDASTTLTFSTPVLDKVSLAVSLAGASSAAVSAEVKCKLRPEALAEWQNTVFDLLLDAWRAWDREWRLQQEQTLGPRLSALDSTSPARNLQIIAEELKREVITWLLDDELFAGKDAMLPLGTPPARWQRYSIERARETAPVVQFLEQALEWGNLSYVCYPYYWARESEWDELVELEGADPHYVNFLRAGSARVIVPARPGFELAVLHWLIYQEPFLGEPLPLPDDDLYVSIATEIRDLTRPPEDGEAGDCWEACLPTTLMWLETEASLPQNEAHRLGKPPNTPKAPYCT